MIDLQNIRIYQEEGEVLHGFNLRVHPGEVCALVGWEEERVQALFRVISGEVIPNEGRVILAGIEDIGRKRAPRRKFGFLMEEPLYDGKQDARTNLQRIRIRQGRRKTGRKSIEELLSLAGVERMARTDSRIMEMRNGSRGEQLSYGIVAALLNDPEVLVLDGVLDDLESGEREQMKEILLRLKTQGMTMLLACRSEEDVAEIADFTIPFS